MAYTSPTITASSTTLATLKSGGLGGMLDRIIATNSFNTNVKSLIRMIKQNQSQRFWDKVKADLENLLRGKSAPTSVYTAELLDYATVLKTQLAVIEEIAVLYDAATKTVTTTINPAGTGVDRVTTLS